MDNKDLPDSFYEDRAELFDILGDPLRLRILEALGGHAMSISELQSKLGVKDDHLLASHLDKMWALVSKTGDERYALDDEGKEALMAINQNGGRIGRSIFALLSAAALLVAVAVYLSTFQGVAFSSDTYCMAFTSPYLPEARILGVIAVILIIVVSWNLYRLNHMKSQLPPDEVEAQKDVDGRNEGEQQDPGF